MTSLTGRTRGNHGGFTLVEVLVAVVIFAMGIAVVLYAFSGAVSALAAARDSLIIHSLIRDRAEECQQSGIACLADAQSLDAARGYVLNPESTAVAGAGDGSLYDVVFRARSKSRGVSFVVATRTRERGLQQAPPEEPVGGK